MLNLTFITQVLLLWLCASEWQQKPINAQMRWRIIIIRAPAFSLSLYMQAVFIFVSSKFFFDMITAANIVFTHRGLNSLAHVTMNTNQGFTLNWLLVSPKWLLFDFSKEEVDFSKWITRISDNWGMDVIYGYYVYE